MSQGTPVPPVAKKIPVRIEQLGRVRTDDYQWMKDDNWQEVLRDPTLIKADVKEHLEAELVDRVTYAPYVHAADQYFRVHGEIGIDQQASVSASEDVEAAGGIYVAGWVWVSNELVDPETEGATS